MAITQSFFYALTEKEVDAMTVDEKETASTYEIFGDYTFLKPFPFKYSTGISLRQSRSVVISMICFGQMQLTRNIMINNIIYLLNNRYRKNIVCKQN